jgi:hypothetical protein
MVVSILIISSFNNKSLMMKLNQDFQSDYFSMLLLFKNLTSMVAALKIFTSPNKLTNTNI